MIKTPTDYFKRKILEINYDGKSYKIPEIIKGRYKIIDILAIGGTGIIYTGEDLQLFNKKVLIKRARYEERIFRYTKDKNREDVIKKARKIINREKTAYIFTWRKEINGTPVLLDFVTDINPDIYGPHKDVNLDEQFVIEDNEFINNETYLVLSYVDGKQLSDSIKSKKENPLWFTKKMITVIGGLLKKYHSEVILKEDGDKKVKMYYLDLKPDNILSDGSNFILIDIGSFSFVVNDTKAITDLITTEGYNAPETKSRIDELDILHPTVDVYSLGATAYEVLLGERPQVSTAGLNIFDFNKVEKYSNIEFRKFLEKMLSYNKLDRFQNMDDVLTALRGLK